MEVETGQELVPAVINNLQSICHIQTLLSYTRTLDSSTHTLPSPQELSHRVDTTLRLTTLEELSISGIILEEFTLMPLNTFQSTLLPSIPSLKANTLTLRYRSTTSPLIQTRELLSPLFSLQERTKTPQNSETSLQIPLMVLLMT